MTEQPPTEEIAQVEEAPKKRFAGILARARVRRGPALWVAAVVLSVSLLLVLGFLFWWPDRQTDHAARDAAVKAAAEGTTAVYTYAANTVDKDIAAAKTHLTGDALTQYEQNAATGVTAVARTKVLKTSATVVGAAVSRLGPDSADVLVFLNQTTTTVDAPGPSMSVGSLLVSLSKVDGKWLISAMKPV